MYNCSLCNMGDINIVIGMVSIDDKYSTYN